MNIKTLSDLLQELISIEVELLNEHKISHPPIIGAMYEGLTKELLSKVVFANLDLKIVKNSFIRDCEREFDILLVEGEGERIPKTDSFIFEPEQIVAIIQVKKNLFSKDLREGYENLFSLAKYFKPSKAKEYTQRIVHDSFRAICKKEPHSQLSIEEKAILETLIIDSILPIRVILGYNGFKKESNLRNSFMKYLEKNITSENNIKSGFGPYNLPSLIICDRFSIIKGNGMPYSGTFNSKVPDYKDIKDFDTKNWWEVCSSSSYNPMYFFLECLWSRLSYKYNLSPSIFGDDLELEPLSKFLDTKFVKKDKLKGWVYIFTEVPEALLKENSTISQWQPTFLNDCQFTIINELCINGEVPIDNELEEFVKKRNYNNLDDFVYELLATDLVYIDDSKIKLLTDNLQCAILPNGKCVAGEDKSGRFTNWILKELENHKKQNSK